MLKNNWPTFDESMQHSIYFNHEKIDLENWSYFKSLYNDYKLTSIKEQKIPKILHQIWLGGEIPPREKERCLNIKENLPRDWTYELWTDDRLSKTLTDNFPNLNIFTKTPNLGQKSDILRNYLLCKFGGVYCDTDIILYKNFNQLLDLDFFCGITYDKNPILMNSVIGSSPGNDLIKDCQVFDKPVDSTDAMSIIDTTGPYFLTRKFLKHKLKNMVAFPNSFFYPYPNYDTCKNLGHNYNSYIKDETFCCHLWACSWI
jgi:mannosyltransferase OCH1-like enzyme